VLDRVLILCLGTATHSIDGDMTPWIVHNPATHRCVSRQPHVVHSPMSTVDRR
jgi:hypothetical protein